MNPPDPKSLFEVAQDVRKEHAGQLEKVTPEEKAAEPENDPPKESGGDPPEGPGEA